MMKNFIEKLKRKLGWQDCPQCHELVRLRFIQMTLVFPDEPPMFARYECPKCKWLSPTMHTSLMDDAAKRMGYDDFYDFAEKKILKEGE